jgi:hypothetical protein
MRLGPQLGIGQGQIGHLGKILNGLVRGARVGQCHQMLAVGMFEEIVDSVLLHKAADEPQIGFAILHAVWNLLVVAIGSEFEVIESRLGEHLFDDILDILVEKNPAVGPVAEQPEPWTQNQFVVV